MSNNLEELRSRARAIFPANSSSCLHPSSKIQRREATCGYVDAWFFQCQECETLLKGVFFHHSDSATIPSVTYVEGFVLPDMAQIVRGRDLEWVTIEGLVPETQSLP